MRASILVTCHLRVLDFTKSITSDGICKNRSPGPAMSSVEEADLDSTGSEDDAPACSRIVGSRSYRPAKRRRINNDSESGSDRHLYSEDEEDNPHLSAILSKGGLKAKTIDTDEAEAESEKPRSKYKIHIPKNADLPKDAFFTQPPHRSSSPHRIDSFHWQKPRRTSTPAPERLPERQTAPNPYVSTTSTRVTLAQEGAVDHDTRNTVSGISLSNDEFDDDLDDELLADISSDAFATYVKPGQDVLIESIPVSSQQEYPSQSAHLHCLAAPLVNLRQTTLFGTQVPNDNPQTQSNRKLNWPLANREEPPTHHKLDRDAMKTWVYPTNLGTIRDYQYSIVAAGLYHNMLVALPTGLGKTFIAATIMLNWFRWTTHAQIVFVAPTKPLVSQQVKACFGIAGIPRSETTMLTGGIAPGLRAAEWQSKRLFFMTPQTLINDLKTGICDPKKLALLVVDEAHRATGGYAYVEVVNFVKRFNTSFRVLALTATPGASVESVQEVIDGLGISRVEIRTEESMDIRQYVHSRKIETILFDNSDEMTMVLELFSKALQPVLNKLTDMNAYWARDPLTLTPYGCTQARGRWMSSDPGRKAAQGIKGMVNTIFSLLASLSHGTELLKFHGIGPFYHKVLAFRNEIHSNGKKGSKYSNQINESEPFQTMMSRVQLWINNPDFVGHPKLEYLQSVVMNHFLDAGDGRGASDPSSTRVMVFSHYRDSAEEIARVLKRNEPMIRPHVFVGQANSKGSDGMDQKKQLDVIEKFQSGLYNTLVATSVGEEGLDIGEVDLIVCYDASASPIRMLQRMGRTGRKRAGNIVVTLMKGKEEKNFVKAKDNYEKMQQEIASGARFTFHDEESRRIVPRDIQPVVDKKVIGIPLENTQPNLPEPTKRGRVPKRPAKKFHMPDGVRTGFVNASRLDENEDADEDDNSAQEVRTKEPPKKLARPLSPEPNPPLDGVLLSKSEEKLLEHKYLDIKGDTSQIVDTPRVDAYQNLQRTLRPTALVSHGRVTKKMVGMLKIVHSMTETKAGSYEWNVSPEDRKEGVAQEEKRARYFRSSVQRQVPSHPSSGSSSPTSSEKKPKKTATKDLGRANNLPPINVSSDEFEEDDSDLRDVLGDEMDNVMDVASSKSSPPPVKTSDEQFYQRKRRVLDVESASGEDLPDFGTLVAKVVTTKEPSPRRRGGTRRVVQDDSDEE